jgi:hypothetical protein
MARRSQQPLAIETHVPSDDEERPHHNRDLTLEKYALLQEQHQTVRSHLEDLLSPLSATSDSHYTQQASYGATPSNYPATTRTTPSTSPYQSEQSLPYASRSSSASRTRQHRRRSLPPGAFLSCPSAAGPVACSLETLLDETTLTQVAAEEAQLFDVNEGIKRTLTELLNCENVRKETAFRTWIQCRLMDTEKELRGSRRRRACAG